MLYLGADHRGFQLKETIKAFLQERNFAFEDLGAFEYNKDDDYPDFALAVAKSVAENPKENRGILLCGSGMGMDVVANKVKGVRATVAYSPESAAHARANDDVHIITLAGDILSEEQAKGIVTIFLNTKFSGEERHLRRIEKIKKIEEEC